MERLNIKKIHAASVYEEFLLPGGVNNDRIYMNRINNFQTQLAYFTARYGNA